MPDSPTEPAEPAPEPDDLEQQLTAAFGDVDHWWVGELPGLGVMHLPLP
jgi:hypothetical protein